MADALDAVVIIPAAMVLANMNVVNANITGEMMNTSQINFYMSALAFIHLFANKFFVYNQKISNN